MYHCLKIPKWSQWGSENGRRGLERVYLSLLGTPKNLFHDLSILSLRNLEPPAKSKMAASGRGHLNGKQALESGLILGYWMLQTTQNIFSSFQGELKIQ